MFHSTQRFRMNAEASFVSIMSCLETPGVEFCKNRFSEFSAPYLSDNKNRMPNIVWLLTLPLWWGKFSISYWSWNVILRQLAMSSWISHLLSGFYTGYGYFIIFPMWNWMYTGCSDSSDREQCDGGDSYLYVHRQVQQTPTVENQYGFCRSLHGLGFLLTPEFLQKLPPQTYDSLNVKNSPCLLHLSVTKSPP